MSLDYRILHKPKDWIPCASKKVKIPNAVLQIPEISTEFDSPEYVQVKNWNEKLFEGTLLRNITVPTSDQNGVYSNDHDYLCLPIVSVKAPNSPQSRCDDHSYAVPGPPACASLNLIHFCNICVEDFTDLFSFNKHMLETHLYKNHVFCFICCKSFLTTACLNNHMGTEHKVFCKYCEEQVPKMQEKWHQRVNKLQKKWEVEEQVWICVICSGVMKGAKDFEHHKKMHRRICMGS